MQRCTRVRIRSHRHLTRRLASCPCSGRKGTALMFTPTPATQQTDTSFLVNQECGCVRRIHYDLFPQRQFRSLMAAWSEELFTIVSRVPAGMRGPLAHWHDFDQIFYCLAGQLELQVGAERYTLTPGCLVAIPAGTPHEHRNRS